MLVDGYLLYQAFVVVLGVGRIRLYRHAVAAYLVVIMGSTRSMIDIHVNGVIVNSLP